jgi:predicted CopG family antitoxin
MKFTSKAQIQVYEELKHLKQQDKEPILKAQKGSKMAKVYNTLEKNYPNTFKTNTFKIKFKNGKESVSEYISISLISRYQVQYEHTLKRVATATVEAKTEKEAIRKAIDGDFIDTNEDRVPEETISLDNYILFIED